jgi:hypothetical protein
MSVPLGAACRGRMAMPRWLRYARLDRRGNGHGAEGLQCCFHNVLDYDGTEDCLNGVSPYPSIHRAACPWLHVADVLATSSKGWCNLSETLPIRPVRTDVRLGDVGVPDPLHTLRYAATWKRTLTSKGVRWCRVTPERMRPLVASIRASNRSHPAGFRALRHSLPFSCNVPFLPVLWRHVTMWTPIPLPRTRGSLLVGFL